MLDALRQIRRDVDAAPSFEHALGIVVARVCLILGTEVCSVYVFDKVTGDLRLIENEGFRRRAIGKVSLAPGEGVVGLVAERGEPLNIENASELILLDRQHLDNNPGEISKEDIITLLQAINEPEN